MNDDEGRQVDLLVQSMASQLAGREPQMQGLILADLLATWLAGHVVKDDEAETAALRRELLSYHLDAVVALIPLAHARIHGRDDQP